MDVMIEVIGFEAKFLEARKVGAKEANSFLRHTVPTICRWTALARINQSACPVCIFVTFYTSMMRT